MSIRCNLGPDHYFYFIYSDISEGGRKKISDFAYKKCHSKAVFIRFPYTQYISSLPTEGSWSNEIYYRLFAPWILTQIDKILYLDGDTIVARNLTKIKALMKKNSFAVAGVCNDEEAEHRRRLSLSESDHYINSGVLLINLRYWREHYSLEQLEKMLIEKKNLLKFPDQDFINELWKNDIYLLPRSYNYMINVTERNKEYKKIQHPDIVHYVLSKPWNEYFEYGTDGAYLKYLWQAGEKRRAVHLWRKHRTLQLKIMIKSVLQR